MSEVAAVPKGHPGTTSLGGWMLPSAGSARRLGEYGRFGSMRHRRQSSVDDLIFFGGTRKLTTE
jgi:hypothetical protein